MRITGREPLPSHAGVEPARSLGSLLLLLLLPLLLLPACATATANTCKYRSAHRRHSRVPACGNSLMQ